jgi:hypothetical protein
MVALSRSAPPNSSSVSASAASNSARRPSISIPRRVISVCLVVFSCVSRVMSPFFLASSSSRRRMVVLNGEEAEGWVG